MIDILHPENMKQAANFPWLLLLLLVKKQNEWRNRAAIAMPSEESEKTRLKILLKRGWMVSFNRR